MGNQKTERDRYTTSIEVQCSPAFKDQVLAAAADLGVSASALGRIAYKQYLDGLGVRIAPEPEERETGS